MYLYTYIYILESACALRAHLLLFYAGSLFCPLIVCFRRPTSFMEHTCNMLNKGRIHCCSSCSVIRSAIHLAVHIVVFRFFL